MHQAQQIQEFIMAGLAALAIAYVLSQFYRSFLAVLTPALGAELGATNADLSIASGAWFAAFALMQFAVGVALDRYGPRRTAAVLLAVAGGGGAALFAAATSPWMITLAMVLIGIGCSPVLMASAYIFARTFKPAQMAILTSWLIGFGSAGNVLGASPLAAAADAFGWRETMAALGAFTVVTALFVLVLVRDPERIEEAGGDNGFAGYLELFKLRALWLILPLMALNYAPAAGIRGLWAGPYLSDVYGADALMIGQVTFFMALAMVAGSFLYGPLDTIFGTRKWVAVIGNSIGVGALVYLAMFPVSNLTAVTLVLVVIGVAGGSYGLLIAHGRAFIPPNMVGRGMTLINFFAIGGVGLMQFATGGVVSATADPAQPDVAYSWLFWFYVVITGLTIMIYLFSQDAKPEKSGLKAGASRSTP
jgi:MFS family permease